MNILKKEIIKINPWWQGSIPQKLVKRPLYLATLTKPKRFIDILSGARRVGKTFLLFSVIKRLLHTVKPSHIFYITAEARKIKQFTILEIIAFFRKLHKISTKTQIFVFIDEVQEIPEWQEQIKYLYDTENIKFYLSGSSSLILNKQTSKLTGRYQLHHIMPLSYNEYLDFNIFFGKKRTKGDFFEDYINHGGYPENITIQSDQYLRQTVESTLYRDLLSYYGIRNPALLEDLFYFLCDKITTPVSANKIAKDLKIDVSTAQFYLKYLQDIYLVYPLYKKGMSNRIVKSSLPKYYINDTGILRVFSLKPRIGHLVENLVFTHLRRQAVSEKPKIYYDIIDDTEIDFVFNQKNYEVKYDKQITEPLSNVTYLVDKLKRNVDYHQQTISKFIEKTNKVIFSIEN